MNYRLIGKLLGWIVLLIAGTMLLSLPWAAPALSGLTEFDSWGFFGLLASSLGAAALGFGLWRWGRTATGELYRREAMAVVGLSWIVATLLGAAPYLISGTYRAPNIPLTVVDAVFESASGFTGSGATVLTDLEDPRLVPRCVLFWRSSTHFLGGLGIIVLFVAILGQGASAKALLRAEMPGPTKTLEHHRVRQAAWAFAAIYLGLNAVLILLLLLQGMSFFDAACHAFGTIATGGFSTYNRSIGHFDSVAIEMTITVFMAVSCVNFMLLYFLVLLQPKRLLKDVEFRVYLAILLTSTALVIAFGIAEGDFPSLGEAFRYGVFQVTSIQTNTGFATADFDTWTPVARGILFTLMFVGGCAGSTSCSIKVIRHILLFKTLKLEIEQSFHPTVVRPLRLGGDVVPEQSLRNAIPMYFGLVLVVVVFSWLLLVAFEPTETWTNANRPATDKLIDCASGVAATINGVGPGLGTVGATQNYAHFTWHSKLVFVALMILGRLEFFPVIVLFAASFWRTR